MKQVSEEPSNVIYKIRIMHNWMKESLIARFLSRMELFFTDADAEMMPALFKNILDGLAQFWNLLSKDMSVIYI